MDMISSKAAPVADLGSNIDSKMLTQKREKFCQALATGMTQAGAYREAYDTSRMKAATVQNNAYKLMQVSEIVTRVAELNRATALRNEISRDDLIAELEEARVLARDGYPAAMVSATMGKAKMLGYLVDRVDARVSTHDDNILNLA